MAVPSFNEMYRPILEFLEDGQIFPTHEIRSYVIEKLELSERDIAERLPSGRSTFLAIDLDG